MRALKILGAVAALVASAWLFRIVLHGYTHHGLLDVFHGAVATTSAFGGVFLLRHAFSRRNRRQA